MNWTALLSVRDMENAMVYFNEVCLGIDSVCSNTLAGEGAVHATFKLQGGASVPSWIYLLLVLFLLVL